VRLPFAHSLLGLGELVLLPLAELLAAGTAIFVALRRKTAYNLRPFFLLGVGALFELALIRVSGTVATAYNQDRAIVQGFAVLGMAMAWSLQQLSGRLWRWERIFIAAAALALSIIYVHTSGLTGALLGGGTQANLANSGEDAERYVVTVPEIAAAQWLVQQANSPGDFIYADRYGTLRLLAEHVSDQGLLTDVTPETIDHNAWVYASNANIVNGRARQYFDKRLVTYGYPIKFLESKFGVMYTNGTSEVFHG
jgi:hypothetical protein